MYDWIKALHVMAVITWMVGTFYLPVLFIYHCRAEIGSKESETFKMMERRLFKGVINPGINIAWILGLYLAWSGSWFGYGWLWVKFTLAFIMAGLHGFFSRWVKDFAADRNQRGEKFYRTINWIQVVFVIGIVIMVSVRPF